MPLSGAGFYNKRIVAANNVDFTGADNPDETMVSDGQLLIAHTALNANGSHIDVGKIVSPLGTVNVGYSGNNITVDTSGLGDLHVAKWIVNPIAGSGGNVASIASALASASSGDTIFIMPGIYTEDLTLKAGVNLVAFQGDQSTPNVTIIGKLSFSSAGTVSIGNIRLQTNSDNLLSISGSAASIVNLNGCYLNCTNSTGISFTSSNSTATINLTGCQGNLGTTGIAYFASSSAGSLVFRYCEFSNTGGSSTANTISAGNLNYRWSNVVNPTTSSGTAGIGIFYSSLDTTLQNATALTVGGSGANLAYISSFNGGTASAISISSSLSLFSCGIGSSNAAAIAGAGSLSFSNLSFSGSSNTITVTTQTGGAAVGIKTISPSTGFVGETVSNSAISVALSNGVPANITSINLTAGTWAISTSAYILNTGTATIVSAGPSKTSATLTGNAGINYSTYNLSLAGGYSVVLPEAVVTETGATTYYLVAQSNFSTGTATANGRIVAKRIG